MERTNERRRYTISLSGAICFFLAIAPVLDPYILSEIGSGITIRVNDVFIVFLAILAASRSFSFSKRYGFLVYWCVFIAVFSLFGILGTNNTSFSIAYKNILIWTVYAVLVMYIWKLSDCNRFFVWVERIAWICVLVVFLQFILGNLGISVWDGSLPGLSLSKYDNWSGYIDPNTGAIRPCGIFQEASYVGIYLLVAYANAIINNKINTALVFAVAMMLTSSMVAVLGSIIVTVFLLFFSKSVVVDKKIKRRFIITILAAMIIIVVVGTRNVYLNDLWQYISRRLFSLSSDLQGARMGSAKWRLLGHIDLFSNYYNTWQKVFGMGAQQYARYFGVLNYSNNIVNIILNYGIFGTVCFVYLFYKLFCRVKPESVVFFVITMIVFFTDQQWFNWFFFYVLSASVILSKEENLCERC